MESSDNTRKTDEIFVSVDASPPEEEDQRQHIRFIDVHIYDLPPGQELPGVECELDQDATIVDEESTEPPARPPRRYRTIAFVLAILVCFSVVSALVITLLLPLLTEPIVTITIVPITRQIDTTQTITVSTKARTQGIATVPGRSLSALTISQQKTVATTGQGHQNATQATGYITFYNAATYPQEIPAGTLLIGADGVQVVTDQTAYVPAGNLLTNGHTTVTAHALLAGPAGNIQGGDVYGPCCRVNVLVANSAFTSGQNARNYHMVQHSDIDGVTNDLKASLLQSAQAAFQQQTQPGETLLTPLPCTRTSMPNHAAGTEAAQVQVSLTVTCTGMVYNTQAMQQQVTQITTQEAIKQLGRGYSLSGTVNATITQATPKNNGSMAALQVHIASTWSYHFTDQQQQRLMNSIAGKSRNTAISMLLHTPGVQSIAISSATLPTDIQHIRVIVVYAG
jgi:hypothetical protein